MKRPTIFSTIFSFIKFESIIPLIAVIFSCLHWYLAATVILIFFLALYLPKKISFLTRLLSAMGMFFVFNILLGLVFAVLHEPYSIVLNIVLYSIGACFFAFLQKRSPWKEKFVYIKSDILISILGVIVFCITLLPLTGSFENRLISLAQGEDNASHYALINSIVANKSFTYPLNKDESGVMLALRNYPQGLHINMAIVSQILANSEKPSQSFLMKSYTVQISAFFGVLFMIILLCARRLAIPTVTEKLFIITSLTLSPALIYLVGMGTNSLMFQYGFHSQIVAYIFLLLTALLLTIKDMPFWGKLLSIAGGGIALSFTWFFLMPVFAAFVIVWAILNFRQVVHEIKRIRSIILIVVSAILMAVPFIIQQSGGDGTSVNTPGGISILPIELLLLCASLIIIFALTQKIRNYFTNSTVSIFFALLVASSAFSLAIGAYQLATIHEFAYYFYKSLYIIPIFASIYSLALACFVYKLVSKNKSLSTPVIIICFIVFAMGVYLTLFRFPIDPMSSVDPSRVNAGLVHKVLDEHEVITTPQTGYDTIVSLCSPIQSYITQRWISAILLTDQTPTKFTIYHTQLQKKPLTDIVNAYKKDVTDTRVVYDDKCETNNSSANPLPTGAIPVETFIR